MKKHLILAEFAASAWAIQPERLSTIAQVLMRHGIGLEASPAALDVVAADKASMDARHDSYPKTGNLAVIGLYGILHPKANLMTELSGSGASSMAQFAQNITQAANDSTVETILLDVDSPGGSVMGMAEAADAVWSARQKKPVIAVANHLAASAAYMIASQASELYVTHSGMAGSIGVYTAHEYIGKAMEVMGVETTLISAGKFKVEGNPFQPLSEEAKASIQATIDFYYSQFINAVARGRGVSASAVAAGYGEGRSLPAPDAIKAGLVDGTKTLDQLVAQYRTPDNNPPNGNATANRRRRLALT